jgi:urea carboxylase
VPDRLTQDGSFTLAAQRDLLEGGADSIAALCQRGALAFAVERVAWAHAGEFARL